ncbi:hypothetical protein AgCh_024023 [Apium graveolens]
MVWPKGAQREVFYAKCINNFREYYVYPEGVLKKKWTWEYVELELAIKGETFRPYYLYPWKIVEERREKSEMPISDEIFMNYVYDSSEPLMIELQAKTPLRGLENGDIVSVDLPIRPHARLTRRIIVLQSGKTGKRKSSGKENARANLAMSTSSNTDASKPKESTFGLSYPMLTKTNYAAWALKMKVFMQAHGVWEAIDPKDPKTTIEEKVDKRALAVIYQGIPEELLLSIAEKGTAKEAWDAIKTVSLGADKVKKARAQTLKGEFESLRMRDGDLLDDFYMKLNGLVTNIRALGEKMEEAYVVKKLLRAVPSKFLQIASAIEQFGDLEVMSIEEVVGSLKAHEERLRGQSEVNQGQLLLTEEEWRKKEGSAQLLLTREEWLKKTSREGARGTSEFRGRDNRGGRDKSKVRCYNFQNYGHFASECRKPRRDVRDTSREVNLSKLEEDEPALLFVESENQVEVILLNEERMLPELKVEDDRKESQIWYLDNGASSHMTGQKGKFKDLDESVTGLVRFGDGSTVNVKGRGTVSFACKNGEVKLLNDVYFIPSLRNNIISLGQLSEDGDKVVIEGEYLSVYDEKGRLLMRVRRSTNRLYKIWLEESTHMALLAKIDENSWLWHVRLGHVNFQALSQMSRDEMVYGIHQKLGNPERPARDA